MGPCKSSWFNPFDGPTCSNQLSGASRIGMKTAPGCSILKCSFLVGCFLQHFDCIASPIGHCLVCVMVAGSTGSSLSGIRLYLGLFGLSVWCCWLMLGQRVLRWALDSNGGLRA